MRRVQLLLPLTCQVKPDVSFAFCIFWRSILALHDLRRLLVTRTAAPYQLQLLILF